MYGKKEIYIPCEIGYSPAMLFMYSKTLNHFAHGSATERPKTSGSYSTAKHKSPSKEETKKNFDADNGVKMLSALHPADVWILDHCTKGRVVKEITP